MNDTFDVTNYSEIHMLLKRMGEHAHFIKHTISYYEYEDSVLNEFLALHEELLEKSGLREFQKVDVNNKSRATRITTYVIAGKRGSGCIEMNGGASLFAEKGDKIHILAYGIIRARRRFKTRIITTDENNKIIDIEEYINK